MRCSRASRWNRPKTTRVGTHNQLSSGERQRVALIRALLMNTDLIFADEAVSALDVSLRIDMMDLMLELQDQFDTARMTAVTTGRTLPLRGTAK